MQTNFVCACVLIQFIYLGFIPPFPKCIHFNNVDVNRILFTIFAAIFRIYVVLFVIVAVVVVYLLSLNIYTGLHWDCG